MESHVENVNYGMLVYIYSPLPPNTRPEEYPIRDVVSIEKQPGGMRETVTDKNGLKYEVELKGLRMRIHRDAIADTQDAGVETTQQ